MRGLIFLREGNTNRCPHANRISAPTWLWMQAQTAGLRAIYRNYPRLYLSWPIVSSCHSSALVQLFIQSWRRIIFNGGILARAALGACIWCIISAYINAYLACPHAHAYASWICLRTALIPFYRMHKTLNLRSPRHAAQDSRCISRIEFVATWVREIWQSSLLRFVYATRLCLISKWISGSAFFRWLKQMTGKPRKRCLTCFQCRSNGVILKLRMRSALLSSQSINLFISATGYVFSLKFSALPVDGKSMSYSLGKIRESSGMSWGRVENRLPGKITRNEREKYPGSLNVIIPFRDRFTLKRTKQSLIRFASILFLRSISHDPANLFLFYTFCGFIYYNSALFVNATLFWGNAIDRWVIPSDARSESERALPFLRWFNIYSRNWRWIWLEATLSIFPAKL